MQKLDRKNIQDMYALTPMQEGMLFHFLKNPGGTHYLEQLCLEISGPIGAAAFEAAWNRVIAGNDMLRTLFRWENLNAPMQIVLKEYSLKPVFIDLSASPPEEREQKRRELGQTYLEQSFDLSGVPLAVTLCKLEARRFVMIISYHHILMDGWSSGILLKEFFRAYVMESGIEPGAVSPVKPPPKAPLLSYPPKRGFKEYVKYLQSRDLEHARRYWSRALAGVEAGTRFPLKRAGGKAPKGWGLLRVPIPGKIAASMEAFSRKHKVTAAALWYTAWGLLLQRYTNSNDVLFGTTVSGRDAAVKGIEEMMGLFIHTPPLRLKRREGHSLLETVRGVKETLIQREAVQWTPLAEIEAAVFPGRNTELFDSIVILENYPLDTVSIREQSGLDIDAYHMLETAHFDMVLAITTAEQPEITYSYNPGVFDQPAVVRLSGHLELLLTGVLENPGWEPAYIDMLTPGEKQQLLSGFNGPACPYAKDKTIHGLFEEQWAKTPHETALYFEETRLTYSDLVEASNRAAAELIKTGVKPDDIVGIKTRRSIEMLTGLLGILKTGAAYLPLDPGWPENRTAYMLNDCGTRILLTNEEEKKRKTQKCPAPAWNGTRLSIPGTQKNGQTRKTGTPKRGQSTGESGSPAYIIYTSGTTGKPKGVVVEHGGVVNMLLYRKNIYRMEPGDVSLQLFSYTFDGFVTSFFTPVISGAAVVLPTEKTIKDTTLLAELVTRRAVTHFIAVPALYRLILEQLEPPQAKSLKTVTLAGDSLPPDVLEITRRKNADLVLAAEYGVTEASVMSTIHWFPPTGSDNPANIGKPIANTRVLILRQDLHPQPIGVPGELHLSGPGTARGYLNRPELTAERFVRLEGRGERGEGRKNKNLQKNSTGMPAPTRAEGPLFSPLSPLPSPLYRTGDLGRWLTDGSIEFLGRIDHQVKIRGFRIEPGEIETQLCRHPNIKEAVIAVKGGKDDPFLCAYVVPISPRALDIGALENHLEQSLPHYMLPHHIFPLTSIPLTPTGKIDTRALPEPGRKTDTTYAPPQDALEEKLVETWAGVLGLDPGQTGIDDDFFKVGGHSLKATRLIARIHKHLGVKAPVDTLFKFPTIRALAGYLRRAQKEEHYAVDPAELREYYPLSPAQKRLYITQHMERESVGYNVRSMATLVGNLCEKRLEHTFQQLIQRHESLRTSFRMVKDNPVQLIHPADSLDIAIEHYRPETPPTASDSPPLPTTYHLLPTASPLPFDLSRPPLIRLGVVQAGETRHILVVDMHHIITDAFSMGVFVREFSALYRGEDLPPLTIQYKDFTLWLEKTSRHPDHRARLDRQEAYWLQALGPEPPVLNLPFDFQRPAVRDFDGGVVHLELDAESAAKLKQLAAAQGTTVFMLMLTIYTVLLAKLCHQEDIPVGTPMVGRRHADLEQVIGFFVNMAVMRNRASDQKTFQQLLLEVKAAVLEGYENQDYPYDRLVEKLSARRDSGRNALFDAVFVWENLDIHLGDITPPGGEPLRLEPYHYERTNAPFDLIFVGAESGDHMVYSINYRTALFKRETAATIGENYKEVITTVLENPDIPLREIAITLRQMTAASNGFAEDTGEFGF